MKIPWVRSEGLFVLLAAVTSLPAAGPYPEHVGIGLGGAGGGANRVFVDVMKSSNRWARAGGGDLDPATEMDADGWPLVDFQVVVFDWRFFGAWWPPPYDDPDQFQPDVSGTYKLSFRGQADISGSGFTIENQGYDPATNTSTADLILPPGSNLLIPTFRDTVGGAKNIRLIRPGYHDRPDQTFTDEFLSAVAPFPVLRFMDWSHLNGQNPDFGLGAPWNTTGWSLNRKRKTDHTQMSDETPGRWNAVAWEYVIELCNQLGCDMWINIPVSADDDYVRKLGILIRTGIDMGDVDVTGTYDLADGTRTTEPLRPEIRIYLEHSNEVWNPGFSQHAWNNAAALAEETAGYDWEMNSISGDTNYRNLHKGYRRHLKRTREIGMIFREVFEPDFGPNTFFEKLRPVWAQWIASFQWDPNRWDLTAAWSAATFGPLSDYFHGIAGAPYMNIGGASSTATPEDLMQRMQLNSDSSAAGIRTSLINRAQQWGVQPLCYEGGPDTGGGDTTNVQNKVRMHRLPAMKELVKHDLADNWFERGGGLFMYFVEASNVSRHGAWGALEDTAIPDTPKYNGLLELIGPQPLAFAIPASFTVAEQESTNIALSARGGTRPYTWSLASGSLPPGLTLSPNDATVTGVPAAGTAGDHGITIRVADSATPSTSVDLEVTITVNNFVDTTPAIATTLLPDGQVGAFYLEDLLATGGNGPLVWNLDAGLLPDGLILSSNGRISGSPQALGQQSSFIVHVADSDTNTTQGDSASAAFTINIASQPAPVRPIAPSNFVARAASNTQVDLSWTDNSANEDSFIIEVSGDGGQNYTHLTTLGADVTIFPHQNLASDTLYYYRIRASNGVGDSSYSAPAWAKTYGPPEKPKILRQPMSMTVAPGGTAEFSAEVFEFPIPHFEWHRGTKIVGGNDPVFRIENVTSLDSGDYHLVIHNSEGTTVSRTVTLAVKAPPYDSEQLVNISTRGQVLTGSQIMIAGFVIAGAEPKSVVLRAIGPTLNSSFGLQDALPEASLELFRATDPAMPSIAKNSAWETGNNATELIAVFDRIGAFQLAPGSHDAVIHVNLDPGAYTAHVSGTKGATGVALIEAYDADDRTSSLPAGSLVNISTRGEVGTGSSILIAGFVVVGDVPKQVLVRGVGPTLGDFGIGSPLADPYLKIVDNTADEPVILWENDDWGEVTNAAATASVGDAAGAFPLAAESNDAALLLWLTPGLYTAEVSGHGNETGVALVEIYGIP